MSQKYCTRCHRNITYMYTYSEYCRDCKSRIYGNVPDHIPDEQTSKYLSAKGTK